MASIFELVAQNIVTTLQTITIANGYEISPLVRRYGTDKKPASKTNSTAGVSYTVEIEVHQGNIENVPETVSGKSYYTMNFMLLGFIIQPQNTTTPTDQIINQIYAAVTKALMADAQRGVFINTTNPLAVDTQVGDAVIFGKGTADYEGVAVPVTVDVRTNQFDPYNQ
jgi:hypothetical protein